MDIDQAFAFSTTWLIQGAASAVIALIVLLLGWFLSGFLSRHVTLLLGRSGRVDRTVTPLLSQAIRYGILVVTFVIVLSQFGVETASILAVLGAAGLAIALALQGTLSNIAAGVMMIWLRPISAGEYIEGEGLAGTVVEIGLFGTRLRTFDGIYVFVPNSKLWGTRIVNYTREPTRMVEVKVGIAYGADLAKARQVLLDLAKDGRVLPEPAPSVFVNNLGASAVDLGFRVWVRSADWWAVKIDLTEKAKLNLDAAGIEIPYNKLDVNILNCFANAPGD